MLVAPQTTSDCESFSAHACCPRLPREGKMILTQCAVCATKLGLSLETDRGRLRLRTWHRWEVCGSCSTRYCSAECREQHWEKGGHDQLCKHIERAGGAEQYNANQKYAEAVAVAAEACADDTKGQTCYICYGEGDEDEGLVRGCACRGGAGFAHVSCLARQAKILYAEAEENNLDEKVLNERWARWYECGLCEQRHHGVVACALGWACWKTYVGRPETDKIRINAMAVLGHGLTESHQHEDALSVREAELSMMRRIGAPEVHILIVQSNLANAYHMLRRPGQALRARQDVYSGMLKLNGGEHLMTLEAANNYASCLGDLQRHKEAKSLLRKTIPVARRVLTDDDEITLRMRLNYAVALHDDPRATLDDFRETVTTLEDATRIARRVLGPSHPFVEMIERRLRNARATELTVSSLADELEAMTPT